MGDFYSTLVHRLEEKTWAFKVEILDSFAGKNMGI
jgi:hypothetical protein